MDITERKITKIAREAEKLVLLTMREEGVGTAEIDLIHALRHHPGCTQAQLAELLHADKAAIARRTKNLEGKGYLTREEEAKRFYGVELVDLSDVREADCIIAAVAHEQFRALSVEELKALYRDVPDGQKVLIDVKGIYPVKDMKASGMRFWRL